MKATKTIVVAYDFTERGKNAVKHALVIGKPMEAKVVLLHIVSSEKQKEKAGVKLDKVARDLEYDYEIETAVIKGSLTTGIKQYAEYTQALLVILGTKNPSQGFEKIFGGKTLKIIMGSKMPYLVVRDKPNYTSINKVVVPINFEFHNKEKLRWVRILSNYFNIKVELFVQNDKNQEERTDTKANYLFAKRYLDLYKIRRKTTVAHTSIPFRDALIEYTHKVNADMIVIMTSEHLSLLDYLIGADEEFVIANNHKIPVMCINPNIELMRLASFF